MLNQNSSLKSIMSKTKVIHSQRQPTNLKQMLTNSYFYWQKDTDPEVKICETKCCGTCPYLKHGKEFAFSPMNQTFWIKHSMNCTSTNLVYVITCTGCGHTGNYIGEMGDVPRNRVTVHKQQIRDPHTCMLGVSKHIDECAAGLTPQFTIFPILSSSKNMRKNKEKFFLFWSINPFLMIWNYASCLCTCIAIKVYMTQKFLLACWKELSKWWRTAFILL